MNVYPQYGSDPKVVVEMSPEEAYCLSDILYDSPESKQFDWYLIDRIALELMEGNNG